ncbi:hypothetical protein BC332_28410 [Capsicum chinense]|nr:hypothetical protein BC332_28410 [Capsicum chinense]
MKRDIAKFMAKCPNYQQVKFGHENQATAVIGHCTGIHAPERSEISSTEPFFVAHNKLLAYAEAISNYRNKFKFLEGYLDLVVIKGVPKVYIAMVDDRVKQRPPRKINTRLVLQAKNNWSLKLKLNLEGKIEFLKLNKPTNHWDVVKTLNRDICYQYRNCCSYEVSIDEDPHYWCTDGFMASSQDKWNKKDFTKGFRRITPLNYTDKDMFVKNIEQKLPDNSTYWGMLYPEECVEN